MAIVEFKDVTRVCTSGTIIVNGKGFQRSPIASLRITVPLLSVLCFSSITLSRHLLFMKMPFLVFKKIDIVEALKGAE